MTSDSSNSVTGKENALVIPEEAVSQYLYENPDFFVGKEDLIRDLTFPHESRGAISIVERQVNLLRERNATLQKNINNFILNAKENDVLFEKVRRIILELLHSSTLEELNTVISTKLNVEFTATASKLVFIGDLNSDMLPLETSRKVLGNLFGKKRTTCGPIEKDQASLFFPTDNPGDHQKIVSAAIIPVHFADKQLVDNIGLPVLVIGSNEANHFNSSLDTLFLDFIGEVLSAHIFQLANQN